MEYRSSRSSPIKRSRLSGFLIVVAVFGLMNQASTMVCTDSNCDICSSGDASKCLTCNSRYVLYNYQCFKCSSNCKKCVTKQNVNPKTRTYCSSCDSGYYLTSSQGCSSCSYGCSSCTSYSRCQVCKAGYSMRTTGSCSYDSSTSSYSSRSSDGISGYISFIIFFVIIVICISACKKAQQRRNRPLVVTTGYTSADASLPSISPQYNPSNSNPVYSQPAYSQPSQPAFGVSPPVHTQTPYQQPQAPVYQQPAPIQVQVQVQNYQPPQTQGYQHPQVQGMMPPPMDNLNMAKPPSGGQNVNYPTL